MTPNYRSIVLPTFYVDGSEEEAFGVYQICRILPILIFAFMTWPSRSATSFVARFW